jgi:co-chaperonin GroES (HSP10)
VLFGKYSGQTVKVDGDELLVMKEEDLLCTRSNSDCSLIHSYPGI